MSFTFENSHLWKTTLGLTENQDIERLRNSFLDFRRKVEPLIKNIETELPGLTIHDITHVDSLWEVADQIIGESNYLNPMEAYVLGGAFLLHDAAHVNAAYNGGFDALKNSDEWKDFISFRFNNIEPEKNSENERIALFEIVRQLHANQAKNLMHKQWLNEASQTLYFLIGDEDLRNYYSEVIGEIAESHHWSSQKVYDVFSERILTPPAFLNDKEWSVDTLKIAFILRTADAAHIDSRRAPTNSYNIIAPIGTSKNHWHYQNKLGRATLTNNESLRLSSGSSFNESERNAWWLAFDTAKMIDNELKDAYNYLSESGRPVFRAKTVLGTDSARNFSKYVKTNGWEPDDISVHVSNLPKLISTLGGKALYGENIYVGIRELIQNGIDAIMAARNLGYLEQSEGIINIQIDKKDEWEISITDNGIGMSKYVLSNTLLDFGKSLWTTDDVRYEHPRLAQTGFRSIGQFGIGFYSVFMLSNRVQIITNRYKSKPEESNTHWKLTFENGLIERPFISKPSDKEQLKKHGTKITITTNEDILRKLIKIEDDTNLSDEIIYEKVESLVKWIFPSCEIDIKLSHGNIKNIIIAASDWKEIPEKDLILRLTHKATEKKLYPIKNEGEIVGRLRISNYSYLHLFDEPYATVTYKGARAGRIYGLDGICTSLENNSKAERNDALPDYPLQSWIDWASDITDSEPFLRRSYLIRLHPLLPEKDLNVWILGDTQCNLSVIEDLLKNSDEIIINIGEFDYDEDDGVRKSDFDDNLLINKNVIIQPTRGIELQDENITLDKILQKHSQPRINYSGLIMNLIKSHWGEYEESDEFAVIGNVDGTEIERCVSVIRKKTTF